MPVGYGYTRGYPRKSGEAAPAGGGGGGPVEDPLTLYIAGVRVDIAGHTVVMR